MWVIGFNINNNYVHIVDSEVRFNNSTISNCTNKGIDAIGSNILLENTTLKNNTECAIFARNSNLHIKKSIIEDNVNISTDIGLSAGGIIINMSTFNISNTIFRNNGGVWAGAIAFSLCNYSIKNCIFIDNYGTSSNCVGSLNSVSNEDGEIKNCIFTNNQPNNLIDDGSININYSDILGQNISGTGNINSTPQFVDATNGDFHLLSISPCIDTGDSTSEYSNEPNPSGCRINMGIYGNTSEATISENSIMHITENTTWNEQKTFCSNHLIVDEGKTLTLNQNCEMLLNENFKITVKPSAKLIINGATLKSTLGTWKGITVLGNANLEQNYTNQGVVEITNNAVIENAVCGVSAGEEQTKEGQQSAGGIIKINGATFKNNIEAVKFIPYQNTAFGGAVIMRNISYILNSTFETSTEIENLGIEPYSFISMHGVNGISVRGNSFSNTANLPNDKKGYGIRAWSTNVNALENTFTNLYKGISLEGTGSFMTSNIVENNFTNNYISLFMADVSGAVINSNIIEIPVNYSSFGFVIQKSDGWHIENNQFSSQSVKNDAIGILLQGNYKPDEIYRNKFSNLRYAVFSKGENPYI